MFQIYFSEENINIPKEITGIGDTDKEILTRLILNFHEAERTVPTLKRIVPKFKYVSGLNRSLESLRTNLQGVGFRRNRVQSKRKVLMERPDIRLQRMNCYES